MDESGLPVTRRTLFIAGGLGTVAAATLAALPASADTSTLEKGNVLLVKDFCAAWSDDSPDAEKIVNQFMADDCVVRFGESVAPVSGHPAAISLFNTFLGNGERYELRIMETFARGPVVVNARIDSTLKNSRKANPTKVVGVFVIKDGKIKEWSDYA
jgi:limonene-1,2-epoxide hydrolase